MNREPKKWAYFVFSRNEVCVSTSFCKESTTFFNFAQLKCEWLVVFPFWNQERDPKNDEQTLRNKKRMLLMIVENEWGGLLFAFPSKTIDLEKYRSVL